MSDFYSDLEFGENAEKQMEEKLRELFPTAKLVYRELNIERQKEGIDYVLVFSDSVTAGAQHKERRNEYPDIFLEVYSNYEEKKDGWIETDKSMYVTFRFPSGRIVMLPTLLLQNAYRRNKKVWFEEANSTYKTPNGCTWKYGETKDKETGEVLYRSKGLCVPIDRLLEAVKKEMDSALTQ